MSISILNLIPIHYRVCLRILYTTFVCICLCAWYNVSTQEKKLLTISCHVSQNGNNLCDLFLDCPYHFQLIVCLSIYTYIRFLRMCVRSYLGNHFIVIVKQVKKMLLLLIHYFSIYHGPRVISSASSIRPSHTKIWHAMEKSSFKSKCNLILLINVPCLIVYYSFKFCIKI